MIQCHLIPTHPPTSTKEYIVFVVAAPKTEIYFFNICSPVDILLKISRTENSGKLTSKFGRILCMGFLYVDFDTKHH